MFMTVQPQMPEFCAQLVIPGAPRGTGHSRAGSATGAGFTITFFNPTLAVTWTAAIAAIHTVLPVHYAPIDALPFALGSCLGIIAWFWLLIRVICRFRTKLQLKPLNYLLRTTGGVLILVGTVVTVRTLLRMY